MLQPDPAIAESISSINSHKSNIRSPLTLEIQSSIQLARLDPTHSDDAIFIINFDPFNAKRCCQFPLLPDSAAAVTTCSRSSSPFVISSQTISLPIFDLLRRLVFQYLIFFDVWYCLQLLVLSSSTVLWLMQIYIFAANRGEQGLGVGQTHTSLGPILFFRV